MTRRRLALFYAIAILGSLVIALLAGEVFVRSLALSTGDGGGRAAKRWNEQYWKPVNAQGYRDVEWAPAGAKPALVFLGDSFTEGHGVGFEQTYYHHLRSALAGSHASYNLGRSGASTLDELKRYRQFRAATGVRPQVLVLQYFGNDMQGRLAPAPQWQPWPGLEAVARHSDLADLLWVYLAGVRYGHLYSDHHLGAYATPVFERHRADLGRAFAAAHGDGARVVFVVFPFLDDEAMIERSQAAYVGRVREVFRARCRPGDAFVDVSPLARTLPPAQRTVNRLDGHPSPALHALLAARLRPLVEAAPGPLPAGVERCGSPAGP